MYAGEGLSTSTQGTITMRMGTVRSVLPALVGGALVALSGITQATMVDNTMFTTDTETGLDWLDLTETRGQSYDEVENQMGAGQRYDGWRHASRDEVRIFWQDAGGVGPFLGDAKGITNWVQQLQRLWGVTYPFLYLHPSGYLLQTSIAMTNEVAPMCASCNVWVYLSNNFNISDSSEGDFADAESINADYRWNAQLPIAHALIRNSATVVIPEPPTTALLALSLLGLGFFGNRRRAPRLG